MTALVALAAMAKTVPIELPDSGTGLILVEMVAKVPEPLDSRSLAEWHVLARALYDGTDEFSRDRLMGYASQAGVTFSTWATSDFIRVRFAIPKGGMDVVAHLVESVSRRATLNDRALLLSYNSLRAQSREPWEAALDPWPTFDRQPRPSAVQWLYRSAFGPAGLTICVSGDFAPGEAAEEFGDRLGEFRAGQRTAQGPPAMSLGTGRRGVSVYELDAGTVKLGDSSAPARLVALAALGVGKDGSLHRSVRNKLGLSYRQEAVVWPRADGMRLRLLIERSGDDDVGEFLTSVRQALMEDVDSWGLDELKRAKAVIKASLEGTFPVSPFKAGVGTSVGADFFDRAIWEAITSMQGGAVSRDVLHQGFADLSLETLKTEAANMLAGSEGRVHR